MKITKIVNVLYLIAMLIAMSNIHAATSTFEDVSLANEQNYAGPGGGRYWSGLVPPANGAIASDFMSGSATYFNVNNECCGGITFWSGFAYSNTTDTTTAGFTNQYSAFPGIGANGSDNYAIAFGDGARLSFAQPTGLDSVMLTNTSYAAISMRDGDGMFGPGKKFGGASGTDEDFFKLTINGEDGGGNVVSSLDFYLADFRFADSADDYIIDIWEEVDLSVLGVVSALSFSFASSDVGTFGINTPTYFALDNLAPVPLPAAVYVFVAGLAALFPMSRRRFLSKKNI